MCSAKVWELALMLRPAAAQTGAIPAVPAEAPVELTFVSLPTGSSVWLGGKKLGTTPLKTKLPAASATLIFRPAVPGYTAQTRSFVWQPGDARRIVIELPMTFGQMRINTTRSWASITFDGHTLSPQPGRWTRVQAGRHTIVALDGRYAAKTTVDVPVNG